jgi:hypothetical protein
VCQRFKLLLRNKWWILDDLFANSNLHEWYWTSCPRPVKLCSDQYIFQFLCRINSGIWLGPLNSNFDYKNCNSETWPKSTHWSFITGYRQRLYQIFKNTHCTKSLKMYSHRSITSSLDSEYCQWLYQILKNLFTYCFIAHTITQTIITIKLLLTCSYRVKVKRFQSIVRRK